MPKDDGVHNYFFGSTPEMPWKRDKQMTDKILNAVRDCVFGDMRIVIDKERTSIREIIDDKGKVRLLLHIEMIRISEE